MGVYTHINLHDQSSAIESLPVTPAVKINGKVKAAKTTDVELGQLDTISSGISGNHILHVFCSVTASSIQVDTLTVGGMVTAVLEPSTLILLGTGTIGLISFALRKR